MTEKTSRSRNPKGGPARTHFKPGNKANPLGQKAHDPKLQALRKLTKEGLKEILELLLAANVDELERIKDEPGTSIIKAAAAAAALRAFYSGDWSFLEGPLARAIGGVKQEVEHTGKGGSPLIPPTPELRAAELQAILATLSKLDNASHS